MSKTQPAPVLIAGMVVVCADGSKQVIEIGPARDVAVDARHRWWQRQPRLVITFPGHTGPVVVRHVESGILATPPPSMPDLPVDSTDARFEDARRLNAA